MARIDGVDLPKEKRVELGLTYIYGIGRSAADEILAATKINPDTRVKDLTKDCLLYTSILLILSRTCSPASAMPVLPNTLLWTSLLPT